MFYYHHISSTNLYSGVSLTGIPDNETPNLVIRNPDDFYPEFYFKSGKIPDNKTLLLIDIIFTLIQRSSIQALKDCFKTHLYFP